MAVDRDPATGVTSQRLALSQLFGGQSALAAGLAHIIVQKVSHDREPR
jgi:hypothetical protein